jgi:integrase
MSSRSFPVRERLILTLCGLAGLRPGEIFGLKWSEVSDKGLRITRRVYRGVIDTPKSRKGNRIAALSKSIISDLEEWRNLSPNTNPDDWIFASENARPTPCTTRSYQHSKTSTSHG